jgi:DNA-binding PadR family transcriptional regulator
MSQIRITTLDFAILGLLVQEPRSGYALRKVFENTAIGNYSSSPGSIYPAINKLKKQGFIRQASSEMDNNHALEIIEEGKKVFKNWLTQPISEADIAKSSDILILKFAFMYHTIDHANQLVFLQSFIQHTANYLMNLKTYHQEESKAMPLHGKLAFEYGIASFEAQLKWAKSALQQLKIISNTSYETK